MRLAFVIPIIMLMFLGTITLAAAYTQNVSYLPDKSNSNVGATNHPALSGTVAKLETQNTTQANVSKPVVATVPDKSSNSTQRNQPDNSKSNATVVPKQNQTIIPASNRDEPKGDFLITMSAQHVEEKVGGSGGVYVYAESKDGFSGTVKFNATISPDDNNSPSIILSPNNVQLTPDKPGSILLRLMTTNQTTPKEYTVTVQAVNGGLKHSGSLVFTVYDPSAGNNGLGLFLSFLNHFLTASSTVTVAPGNAVRLDMTAGSQQPNGYTGHLWLNATVTPDDGNITVPMPGAFEINQAGIGQYFPVIISTKPSTPIGTYIVKITLTGNNHLSTSNNFQLQVTRETGDFSLSADTSLTMHALGFQQVKYVVTSQGFQGNVTTYISAPNVQGLTAYFSGDWSIQTSRETVPLSYGDSRSSWGTVVTAVDTPPGTYNLTLTATSWPISHTVKVSLTVLPKETPVLHLSTNSNHYSAVVGSDVRFEMSYKLCGYAGWVDFTYTPSSSIWPRNATGVSFTGYTGGFRTLGNCIDGTIPLTVSTAKDAALGDYTMTIIASAGSLSDTIQLVITVTK